MVMHMKVSVYFVGKVSFSNSELVPEDVVLIKFTLIEFVSAILDLLDKVKTVSKVAHLVLKTKFSIMTNAELALQEQLSPKTLALAQMDNLMMLKIINVTQTVA